MKKIAILGLTGSIGKTALHALNNYKNSIAIVSGSVNTSIQAGLSLCEEHNIGNLCITGGEDRQIVSPCSKVNIFTDIRRMLDETRPDIVLNGISGSAGLAASIEVIKAECALALANKETVVLGGASFFRFVKEHNGVVIPVDSEHSAIDELLLTHGKNNVNKLIITASGGPFFRKTRDELCFITPNEAVKHPTWKMGPKISIDSATLANKGLEVIEAHFLFGYKAEDIEVVIHPESVVHSMVQTTSGQVYAQMSKPDMSGPIMRALLERNFTLPVSAPPDFSLLDLHFSMPDYKRFPILRLAFECVKKEAHYPIIYNIADEVAVSKFINGELRFTDIDSFVSDALEKKWEKAPEDVALIPEYLSYVERILH